MRVRWAVVAVLSMIVAVGCGRGDASKAGITIGFVPKGSTHEHWKRVRIGAEKAAAEYSAAGTPVEVIWKGPLREDDREQQVQVVEGFTSQGVTGSSSPRSTAARCGAPSRRPRAWASRRSSSTPRSRRRIRR